MIELEKNQAIVSNTNENFEPYFSWSACDICESRLGGNRYPVAIIEPGIGPIDTELEACEECYLNL